MIIVRSSATALAFDTVSDRRRLRPVRFESTMLATAMIGLRTAKISAKAEPVIIQIATEANSGARAAKIGKPAVGTTAGTGGSERVSSTVDTLPADQNANQQAAPLRYPCTTDAVVAGGGGES